MKERCFVFGWIDYQKAYMYVVPDSWVVEMLEMKVADNFMQGFQ